MNETMTVGELLSRTVETLEGIMLPVSMSSAASTIAGCANNIRLCVEAMQAKQQEAKQPKEEEADGREADAE